MIARPNKKAFGIAAGAVVLFFIGSNIQAGWLYVLGASLIGVIVAGLVVPGIVLRGVRFERHLPPTTRVGDQVPVSLTIRNTRRGGSGPLSGSDIGLGEERRLLVGGVRGRSQVTLEYEATPRRRGVYEHSEIRLRSGFPFGMGVASRTFRLGPRLIVHPRWVPLSGVPLLEAASIPSEALHDRRRRGGGMDFFGIREYRPGDSFRHVHWKSTARGGRLLVREFEELPASRIGIFVETREVVGTDPETTLEDSIACAASLALYGLEVGHPVQLFYEGPEGLQHLYQPGRAQVLDWLSAVESEGKRGLSAVVTEALAEVVPRSTNVIIFPTTSAATAEARVAITTLQSAGTRVIAIVVSAHTYDGKTNGMLDRDAEEDLIGDLASMRVIAYRVERDRDLAECLMESSTV